MLATAAILDVPIGGADGAIVDGNNGIDTAQGRLELWVPQPLTGGARLPTIDLGQPGDAQEQELALSLVLQTPQAGVSDVRMDIEGGKVKIHFEQVK